MSARRRGRGRPKPTYKWSGINWQNIAVTTNGVILVLVSGVEVERHGKVVCKAVRGWVNFHHTDTDAGNGISRYGAKLGVYNINDAQTITDDVDSQDTDEEDIAKRHLWMDSGFFKADATNLSSVNRVEIFVKAGIILGDPKQELMLLCNNSAANRVRTTGYLRALLQLP